MSPGPSASVTGPSAAVRQTFDAPLPLERWLERSPGVEGGRALGLIGIGINHFREVNAALGHRSANRLLADVAERLQAALSVGDGLPPGEPALTRLTGPAFAVAVPDVIDAAALYELAERLLRAFDSPFPVRSSAVSITASAGVVQLPAPVDIDHALGQVDAALAEAKQRRRGAVLLFDPASHRPPLDLLSLRAELRAALGSDQLTVHFQPVLSLDHSGVEGVEALVRWQHPTLGLLRPEQFLPYLDRSRIASGLSEQVLDTALAELRRWRTEGLVDDDFYVAVNLTATELVEPLDHLLEDLLDRHHLPAEALMIEVTESGLLDHSGSSPRAGHGLRDLGVQLAIDDLGSACAPLDRLLAWPATTLKLHRGLVGRIATDEVAAAVVGGVVSIAHSLELGLIAEGVETAPTAEMLRELAVPSGQGFLWSPPLGGSEMRTWLEEYRAVIGPAPEHGCLGCTGHSDLRP
ncbi:MAG: bifunctional diguanylate cyclase/phosphodiesterase [Acidimicrobiales bacterium]|nr:bifunctional diguanylate cyclase/phosphodiesterase [Acidimicrobiales bacterium]